MKNENNLKYIKGGVGEASYYLTDITLNYKRIRRYAGRTKAEAKEYLAKLRLAAKDGTLDEILNPQKLKDRFKDYARALLDSAEWKQKRSAYRNEISLKHLTNFFKDMHLADINPGKVRQYITGRKNAGKKPATINRELSLLKSILFAAEYDGLIPSNPIRGRRVKKLDEANSREKTILSLEITDEKLRKLIDCAAPHFKPVLKIALITGMRQGEILNMKWKDINFRLGTIHIPEENSKTKKERFIPIDSILFNTLDSIDKKGEYVFMNDANTGHMKDIRGAFASACERAGIPSGREDGLTFHDCRHLAAYRLVKLTDIVTASKILGHSDVKMTMRYVHPTEKDKREAIEKAAENLTPTRQYPVNEFSTGTKTDDKDNTQVH
jgi:integrase